MSQQLLVEPDYSNILAAIAALAADEHDELSALRDDFVAHLTPQVLSARREVFAETWDAWKAWYAQFVAYHLSAIEDLRRRAPRAATSLTGLPDVCSVETRAWADAEGVLIRSRAEGSRGNSIEIILGYDDILVVSEGNAHSLPCHPGAQNESVVVVSAERRRATGLRRLRLGGGGGDGVRHTLEVAALAGLPDRLRKPLEVWPRRRPVIIGVGKDGYRQRGTGPSVYERELRLEAGLVRAIRKIEAADGPPSRVVPWVSLLQYAPVIASRISFASTS